MALAARKTAPKEKAADTIIVRVLTGKEVSTLATRLSELDENYPD